MLTRRRFLAISAAGLATGTLATAPLNRLSFHALGTRCTLTLPGPADRAAQALASVAREIGRIERSFSLWNPASELSRLNRNGSLARPSPLFRRMIALSRRISARTGGSFDVTVQPRWTALATGGPSGPVNWQDLRTSGPGVAFAQPGMAATFNGIAQGLAADRAERVLREHGYRDLIVDLGEFRASGEKAPGQPWRIGVAHPVTEQIATDLPLSGAAATSAPGGTTISGQPHIFDPLNRTGARWASVTVLSHSALWADAFSTAIAAAPIGETQALLRSGRITRAILIDDQGTITDWRG